MPTRAGADTRQVFGAALRDTANALSTPSQWTVGVLGRPKLISDITGGSQQGAYFPSGLDEQPSVGPPPTRIVGASEWPAAAALSGFSAGAGVCQAFPPPLPNESKAT